MSSIMVAISIILWLFFILLPLAIHGEVQQQQIPVSRTPPCFFTTSCALANQTAMVIETVNDTECQYECDIRGEPVSDLIYDESDPTDDPRDVGCPDNYNAEEECVYTIPSLSDISVFNQAREDNQKLMDDLAEVLNCNDETLCTLVFAGHGIIKLEFSDGHEDSFRLDFVGLNEAKTLVGDIEEDEVKDEVKEEDSSSDSAGASETEAPREEEPEPPEDLNPPPPPIDKDPIFEEPKPEPRFGDPEPVEPVIEED
ncbi:hypothetical protein BH18THE2_BH18THE2_41350 [soil metagenome]